MTVVCRITRFILAWKLSMLLLIEGNLYENRWAVKIKAGGSSVADRLAALHGFTNLGQVSINMKPQPGAK